MHLSISWSLPSHDEACCQENIYFIKLIQYVIPSIVRMENIIAAWTVFKGNISIVKYIHHGF